MANPILKKLLAIAGELPPALMDTTTEGEIPPPTEETLLTVQAIKDMFRIPGFIDRVLPFLEAYGRSKVCKMAPHTTSPDTMRVVLAEWQALKSVGLSLWNYVENIEKVMAERRDAELKKGQPPQHPG